jgi:hypothetical protein
VISAAQAWRNAGRKPLWQADVAPPFALSEDDRFFFFGSCFAREMERALRFRGLTVLSTMFAVPPHERVVGLDLVNTLRVPVIVQELSWAIGETPFPLGSLLEDDDGLWHDLQIHSGIRPVTRERCLERRAELQRYFARIVDADVVVVDVSGVDLWYDRQYGLALNAGAPRWALRREPDRFEYHLCDSADLRAALLELRALLARCGGPKRMILMVNPMPLAATFRPGDLKSIETWYRSAVRTVVGELADEFDDIAYVPAFEAVVERPRAEAFGADNIRVREDVIDEVMEAMLRSFGLERAPTEPDYDETAYLRANPDVAALVRDESVRSGYEHWVAEGRAAGRPLSVTAVQIDFPIETVAMRATISAEIPRRGVAGRHLTLPVEIANTGTACYATAGRYPVYVCYRWYDERGELAEVGRSVHTALPEPVLGGESATVLTQIAMPESPGQYTLALTLLQHCVAWFDDLDPSNGTRGPVFVENAPAPSRPEAVAVS